MYLQSYYLALWRFMSIIDAKPAIQRVRNVGEEESLLGGG